MPIRKLSLTLATHALHFTSLNQLARLASGPVILGLLPFFLSVEQQGFWFTMSSITAFMAFADMGLSMAVIQYAAHEHAKLEQSLSQDITVATRYRLRLETLRLFAWQRSTLVALLVLPFVVGAGFYMLSGQDDAIHWKLPWILLCFTSAASLILTIVLAYHEGCNDVARIQRLRAVIAMVNVAILALGLLLGLGLWTLSLATGASTALGFGFIWKHSRKRKEVGCTSSAALVKAEVRAWSKEVSPLLSKYAASWISGYAMFQLFTPIVFKFEGAAAAGRVGLTIAIFTAIFTLSSVWSTYQLPRFSMAIAVHDRNALNHCMTTALKGALLTYCVLMSFFITVYLGLHHHPVVTERILGTEAILTLAIVWGMQLLVHNMAVYLRAFKEEPLVWHSLIAAAYTVTTTLITIKIYGLDHLFIGLLTVYIWFVPAVYLLFKRKRESIRHWPKLTNQQSSASD